MAAQPRPLPSARAAPPPTVPPLLAAAPLQPTSDLVQHNEHSTADCPGSPSCSGIDALLLAAQACRGGPETDEAAGSGTARVAAGDAAAATPTARDEPAATSPGASQYQPAWAAEYEAGAVRLRALHHMLEILLQPRARGDALASRYACWRHGSVGIGCWLLCSSGDACAGSLQANTWWAAAALPSTGGHTRRTVPPQKHPHLPTAARPRPRTPAVASRARSGAQPRTSAAAPCTLAAPCSRATATRARPAAQRRSGAR